MKKVSKQFIEAMNGILNGEEWKRKSGGFSLKFGREEIIRSEGYMTQMTSSEDMQATDWVKINE